MSSVVSDTFVNDQMHEAEDFYHYGPGGLHPVHLGHLLDGSRYKVVHKLGQGTSSTVWLARDRSLCKYVAVKIKEPISPNSTTRLTFSTICLEPHPTILAGFTALNLFFKGTSG
ncbi:hypothetical protein MMC31_000016 [Peltigera leucophlebia]|nr:hypothetical protein [Peltigera leucophlebia]